MTVLGVPSTVVKLVNMLVAVSVLNEVTVVGESCVVTMVDICVEVAVDTAVESKVETYVVVDS